MPNQTVELLKPHTHTGVAYPPSAVITLDDDLAKWLCEIGSAQPVLQAAKPSKQPNITQE